MDYRPNVDEVATMKDVKILVPLNCNNAFPLFVTVGYSGGMKSVLVLSSARVGNNLLAETPRKSLRGFKMGWRDKRTSGSTTDRIRARIRKSTTV